MTFDDFIKEHMEPILYFGNVPSDINNTLDNTYQLKPRPCHLCGQIAKVQKVNYPVINGRVRDGRCNTCKRTVER